MHLRSRDLAVIGGLVVMLVAAGVVSALPPAASPDTGSPSSTPLVTDVRAYREGVLGQPISVNPLAARTQADRDIVGLAFAGLLRAAPDGTLVPDLAASWSVDETGAIYTVRLRTDARWHDGEPVTVDDVVYTVQTIQDPAYVGPAAGSWDGVKVEVLDDDTVRFRLETPIAGFAHALTQPLAPFHLLGDIPIQELLDHPFGHQPVGSGPYRVVLLSPAEAILEPAAIPGEIYGTNEPLAAPDPSADSLAPTPLPTITDQPLPYLGQIHLLFYPTAEALIDAYRAGELDAASGLPPAAATDIAAETGSRLLRYPISTLTAVLLNVRPDKPGFSDAGVRRALLLALDRDAIVSSVLAGMGTRADAPIPPFSWAFDPAASPQQPYDPEAAAKLMTDAGWRKVDGRWTPKGWTTPYPLDIIAPNGDANPTTWSAARQIAAAWKRFGFETTLTGLPPDELVGQRLAEGDFTTAVVDIALGADPDLYPLLGSTQTVVGGANLSGVQSAALDALLVAARTPGSTEDRRKAFGELQKFLAFNEVLLPIYFRDEPVVVSRRLEGSFERQISDPGERYWDVLTWRLAEGR
jgi:peptide/nickel transport system substrate-binding protein